MPRPNEIVAYKRRVVLHHFNDEGVHTGSVEKDIPRGVGYPRNSTTTAPPEQADGVVAVYDQESDTWSVVPDHRGQKWYNTEGKEVEIEDVGEPEGLTAERPEVVETVTAKMLSATLQHTLDTEAMDRGFESILDAVSFAGVTGAGQRQVDGDMLQDWRLRCLRYYDQQASGPLPTIAQFTEGLPTP